jgi:hypothetical protein
MRARGPRRSVRRARTAGPSVWTVNGDRTAVLLVRVWLEGDDTEAFRGRLTAVDTSTGPRAGEEATVAVASSPEEVIEAVRAWLDGFLGGVPGPVGGGR